MCLNVDACLQKLDDFVLLCLCRGGLKFDVPEAGVSGTVPDVHTRACGFAHELFVVCWHAAVVVFENDVWGLGREVADVAGEGTASVYRGNVAGQPTDSCRSYCDGGVTGDCTDSEACKR